MTATHTADVYLGNVTLADVQPDPDNGNMVYATVVMDSRDHYLEGCRVWVASAQVSAI